MKPRHFHIVSNGNRHIAENVEINRNFVLYVEKVNEGVNFENDERTHGHWWYVWLYNVLRINMLAEMEYSDVVRSYVDVCVHSP